MARFGGMVEQIKAELQSIGQLYPGRGKERNGFTVFLDPRLPNEWVGVCDPKGRSVYGPFLEILNGVRNYVRKTVNEGNAECFQESTFWLIFDGFPHSLSDVPRQNSTHKRLTGRFSSVWGRLFGD
jgi:hypothetical protein